MGFFGKGYHLLILSLSGLSWVLAQEVCVHMKDCPLVYELLKMENGQQQIEELICEKDERYPKVWCKISCVTNSNENGFCSLNTDCITVTIPKNSTISDVNLCDITLYSTEEYVCCPSNKPIDNVSTTTIETTQTLDFTITTETNINSRYSQPDSEICGIQSDVNKVANGKIASLYDHPWSALLQYSEKGKYSYKCGGALISNKFVITAAHCVDRIRAKPTNVVLGEYNVSSEIDCFLGHCMPKPLTVSIKSITIHPGWLKAERPFYNDLALIELQHLIKYNESIRPICLPSSSTKLNTQLTVAGWGKTEFGTLSDVKRIANLDVQPRSTCLHTVSIPLKENQLCVGGNKADSCDGDSGGPLMEVDYSGLQPVWRLVGVVSLGSGKCGAVGKPAIYTNISYYLKWIVEHIT